MWGGGEGQGSGGKITKRTQQREGGFWLNRPIRILAEASQVIRPHLGDEETTQVPRVRVLVKLT